MIPAPSLHSPKILCGALLVVTVVHVGLVWMSVTPILQGNLWDSDAYMHLAWARHLVLTGSWYEDVFLRINAPFGAPLHFSRLFDLLLLAGASVGAPFVGFESALYGWGVVVGPALHALSLGLLSWGTRPFFSGSEFLVAAVIFSTQRHIVDYMMVGRPDHHALLLLLLVGTVACMLRALSDGKGCRLMGAAGVLSGLSLWVLVEGLLIVLLPIAVWGLAWVVWRERFAVGLRSFCASLLAMTIAAVALELPPGKWLTPIYDRVSVVHAVLALAIAIASAALVGAERYGLAATRLRRGLLAASAVAGVGSVVAAAFPLSIQGPYATIDPLVSQVLMARISETLPSVPVSPASTFRFILNLGPAFICLPVAVHGLLRAGPAEGAIHFLSLVGLAVFIPYSLAMMRGTAFALVLMVLPWTFAVRGFWHLFSRLSHPALKLALASAGTMIILFGNWLAAVGFAKASGLAIQWQAIPPCQVHEITPFLESLPEAREGAIILAEINIGPELVYRTSYSVVGAPYHQNAEGIKDTVLFFGSVPDDTPARTVARRRGVDLVLLCRNISAKDIETVFRMPTLLVSRLYQGRPPYWLEPVPLPPALAKSFFLYRVVD